jgi:outer membrane cobalamin receptor
MHKSLFCLTTAILLFNLPLFSQSDSALYIIGNELLITPGTEKKVTGLSVGKISLHPTSLAQLPSMSGNTDLLKLLELTPGVQNSGDANTSLYIRGGDPGQNLLLYNGTPLYLPGHLLGFFSLLNSGHITSLEMSKTATNPRFGGRLSSVIDIKTKQSLPDKTSVSGNTGLLSSQATLQLPLGSKFGLYLSARTTYIEMLMQPLLDITINKNAKNKVEGLNYQFYDVNLTLLGQLSKKDRITIDAFFGKDNFKITDLDFLLNGQLNWKNLLLSARWERRINENRFSQQLYFSEYANTLAMNQAKMDVDIHAAIQDAGYKNKYTFFIQDIPLESGLQYAFHKIQPQTCHITNTAQQYRATTPPQQEAQELGLYLAASFSLTPKLTAEGGIRYQLFYHNQLFQNLEPRLALRYRLQENISLRTGYSRQNQYLHALNASNVGIPLDFWTAASPGIQPQSGDEFSVGYFHSFNNENWELSGEIYYRTLHHVKEYSGTLISGETDACHLFSGNGRAYGLELILKKNYGKLTGWASYTLGRSERTFPDINQGKTFPARFDRRHDLSLALSCSLSEKWEASLVYVYATGNAYTLPSSWYFINSAPVKEYGDYHSARMPAYNRTDLSVNYWYRKDNGINLSIYNLFMINNPVYIFMNVKQDENTGNIQVSIKHKKLYTLVPSLSWRFKF